MPDDRDSGRENADGNDRSLSSVNKAYRAVVPHYPLHSEPKQFTETSMQDPNKNLTEERLLIDEK